MADKPRKTLGLLAKPTSDEGADRALCKLLRGSAPTVKRRPVAFAASSIAPAEKPAR